MDFDKAVVMDIVQESSSILPELFMCKKSAKYLLFFAKITPKKQGTRFLVDIVCLCMSMVGLKIYVCLTIKNTCA